jgi:hypothetical protein
MPRRSDPDLNGDPVEGVRVDNMGTSTNLPTLGGYTDSDGRYIITGASANATTNLEFLPIKYGYTFTNLLWTNPIAGDADFLKADFVAIPLPAVTITASTNLVPENSPSNFLFTLTRAGDTATNLTIMINLSGPAVEGST